MDSIEVRIDKTRQLIRIRVCGHFNEEFLERIVRQVEAHREFSTELDVLFDASHLSFGRLPAERFAHFADLARDGGHRVAIVANTDLAYGVSRMYQAWTDQKRKRKLRVFRSAEEALAWLGTDVRADDGSSGYCPL